MPSSESSTHKCRTLLISSSSCGRLLFDWLRCLDLQAFFLALQCQAKSLGSSSKSHQEDIGYHPRPCLALSHSKFHELVWLLFFGLSAIRQVLYLFSSVHQRPSGWCKFSCWCGQCLRFWSRFPSSVFCLFGCCLRHLWDFGWQPPCIMPFSSLPTASCSNLRRAFVWLCPVQCLCAPASCLWIDLKAVNYQTHGTVQPRFFFLPDSCFGFGGHSVRLPHLVQLVRAHQNLNLAVPSRR